jgi:hypothetical protein
MNLGPFDRLEGLVYFAIVGVAIGVSKLFYYLGMVSVTTGSAYTPRDMGLLLGVVYFCFLFLLGFNIFPKETDRKYLRLKLILLALAVASYVMFSNFDWIIADYVRSHAL